jgi:hypothetical protein
MVCALLIMELVLGKEIEREFPGNNASAYRGQEKGKGERGKEETHRLSGGQW